MKNYLIIGAFSGIENKLADMLANYGNKVYGTFRLTKASGHKTGV